jgi:ABC-2 type transport system ATP-binding protein
MSRITSLSRSHPLGAKQSHARSSCFGAPAAPHLRVMSRDPAIEVERLVKIYKQAPAVDDISFSIPRGSITGLLGGNGAGKTTTIAMIMGLLLPTSGTVKVLGAQMPHERYRVLQRMNFESPYVEMPMRLTIRQNLRVFGMLYGVTGLDQRIEELGRALDLTQLLDRPTGKLSAGQKTRVSLAKSLINSPELLLLDEPTASLDPDTADWVRSHLENYCRERQATMLLASHNMHEVERLCERVIIMKQGRIEDDDTPARLLTRYGRRTLEEVFLDVARGRDEAEVAQ